MTGDLDLISHKEFRQQVYLSKDQNGLSAFHKAIANGHKQMAEHLLEKTDRAIVNQVLRTVFEQLEICLSDKTQKY